MLLRQLFENTGSGKTAVLGWGRGMGHKGHMLLAKAVLHHARELNARPYFVVSRTSLVDPSTGQPWADRPTFTKTKDDPLTPDEKLATYRKVFPQNAEVFSVATADATKLEQVMAKIAQDGYKNVVLVVGEDQKNSMGYLTNPDKSGVPPYKQAGLDSLEIISRQDTTEPSSMRTSPSYQEGPRATPMRQVLLDPAKSEEEQFAIWRRDMPDDLSDDEVLDLMRKAKQRMSMVPAAKRGGKVQESIILSEEEVNKLGAAVLDFYKPIVNQVHKEKVADYASQAQGLVNKVDNPGLKKKLIGILKKGAENPSLQGSLITATAAILSNLVFGYGRKYGLTPLQTGIALQVVLNTVIPTITSRLHGKDWTATVKTVLSSVATGAGIASLAEKNATEDESPVIRHMVKDIENPPVIMQRRAKRDQERLQQYHDSQFKRDDDEDLDEKMLPKSAFVGSNKNKLGPAAHLKGTMKRPARSGDLVGGAEESVAENVKVNLGGVSMKKIQVGDIVKYFGEKVEVIGINPDRTNARVTTGSKTWNVRLSDLKPLGQGVVEDIDRIMAALIEKIIVNEAIQNNKR